MTNHYHAKDYTPAEILAMPAGPLLDWLALQGLGYQMNQDRATSMLGGFDHEFHYISDGDVGIQAWWTHRPEPSRPYHDRYGTIEYRLNRLAEMGYEPAVYRDRGKWTCAITICLESIVGADADTIGTAIARACALLALSRVEVDPDSTKAGET